MSGHSSLGLVHLLAAVHIFQYQVFNLRIGFFAQHASQLWAPSWYGFLIALEGFKLTHTQLREPEPEVLDPILPFLYRQAARLHPAYFLSLLLLVLQGSVNWDSAHVNVVPVFTWWGTTADGWHRAWNGGGWTISDIALHILLWRFVYPRLLPLSSNACWCAMGASMSIAYGRIFVSALGLTSTVVMWAPYTFGHFACGMCLAKLFVMGEKRQGALRDTVFIEFWPYRYAASGLLSLTFFLCLFHSGPHPDSVQSFAPFALWLGLLMPLQLLLIWALAIDEGPLAQLCRWPPFSWASKMGHATFVLHWNVVVFTRQNAAPLAAWSGMTGKGQFLYILLPATLLLSLLTYALLERPLQSLAKWHHELAYPKDE